MQISLFTSNTPKVESKPSPPSKPISTFTPPTLENALIPGFCDDYAMMWLRTLAKKHKSKPSQYFEDLYAEIQCKKTGTNVVATVRDRILANR